VEFPVHDATDRTGLIDEDIGNVGIIMHENDSEKRRRNVLQEGISIGLERVQNNRSTLSAHAIFANEFRMPFDRE
jgi:hypothetical protein